jgi:glucose/arabinose dehydrogenase
MNTTRSLPSSRWFVIAAAAIASLSGCYGMRPSSGGGETEFTPPRRVNAADVALPDGYSIEAVATALTYPTGVAFDEQGTAYVVESGYAYGEDFTAPRLLRIAPGGQVEEVARGEKNGPWTGVVFARGHFFIAEGGQLEGGRILRVDTGGRVERLISDLPSHGDHHTNGPAVGRDGKIYFAQGTATNSAVVGPDNAQFGWLKRYPKFHDVPCRDAVLNGINYPSKDALGPSARELSTGAFSPYGTPTTAGQRLEGRLPCNGAIMRINPDGSSLELVASGLRNPFGLAFDSNGTLYATENGYDDRGSRPVWGTGDVLWRIEQGAWYGWPDYSAGEPLDRGDLFKPPGKDVPARLLREVPAQPPKPVATLGVHASANGLDFSRSDAFGHAGEAFIAEFGDQAPTVGKTLHPVGFRVVRVNVSDGRIEEFASNEGHENSPASRLGTGGLERPVAVRFSPDGRALYVVDFGVLLMDAQGAKPQRGTGVLWKITRSGS